MTTQERMEALGQKLGNDRLDKHNLKFDIIRDLSERTSVGRYWVMGCLRLSDGRRRVDIAKRSWQLAKELSTSTVILSCSSHGNYLEGLKL